MTYFYDHIHYLVILAPFFCLFMASRAKKRYKHFKNTGKLPEIFAAQRNRRLWHIGATLAIIAMVCLLWGCTSMYKYSNDPLKRTHHNKANHKIYFTYHITKEALNDN